jgi:hypothetical protein
MHIIGALALAVLILGGTGMYVRNRTGRVAAVGTPRAARTARAAQRQARRGGTAVSSKAQEIWAEAHSADWLERRRAARARQRARTPASRQAATAARAAGRGTATAARGIGRFTRAGARKARSAGQRVLVPQGGIPVAATPPVTASSNGHSPVPPVLRPVPPPAPRETPKMSTSWHDKPAESTGAVNGAATGAGADLFTAIQALTSRILGGNLRAKQGGIMACGDGLDYISQALSSLGRALSEPGQEYPAAIWEPIMTAAAHVKAASSACGESTSAVNALAGMQVGELADSATRAPHNSQLNSA